MPFNPNDKHHRRSIRLKEYNYAGDGLYFVTICVEGMKCVFGEVKNDEIVLSKIGEVIKEEWLRTPSIRPYVQLGEFMVMPNHFHGIIQLYHNGAMSTNSRGVLRESRGAVFRAQKGVQQHAPTLQPHSLGLIINGFKATVTNKVRYDIGFKSFAWQRNYYEHIIRNEKDHQNSIAYITGNPMKWSQDDYYTS